MTSAAKEYMVLTAVGADRPGLVERISGLIHEAGANLEDSRMAILGGEFALILLFSGGTESVLKVEERSAAVAAELDLGITLRRTRRRTETSEFLPYSLRVSGVDRPGIVAHVSALLAGRGVNVAGLESRLAYAPLSGTPMFHLNAKLQVPSQLALATLRADIAHLCEEENLDFILESDAHG